MRRLGRRLTQKTREGAPALPGGRLARCRNGRLEPPCRESGQHERGVWLVGVPLVLAGTPCGLVTSGGCNQQLGHAMAPDQPRLGAFASVICGDAARLEGRSAMPLSDV
jgi:hypothetical protein